MSSDKTPMDIEIYKALFGPMGYAVAARHPARNEQILVVAVAPDQENHASVPLTFVPHRSCGDHIDVQVYRIRPDACKAEPPLQPGDILPLSDGTFVGSICHNLDDKRTEDPTIRVCITLDGPFGLSVRVVETPELQERYYLSADIPGGKTP